MTKLSALEFFRQHGDWSDPRGCADAFDAVPGSVPAIASAVQGLFVHDYFGAHLYAEPPADIAHASRATLRISDRLPTLHRFGDLPLTKARHSASRAVGTCRDIALLACSMLRHHGFAARVRCGFARYFHPPTYEDHWICEYFDADAKAWKMADAQLDAAHLDHLAITFDANDLPADQFLFPWQIWEQFGTDRAALERFGHGEAKGFWFVRVSLARDLLSLAKHEVSDWDSWRDHPDDEKTADTAAVAHCARLAAAARQLDQAKIIDPDAVARLVADVKTPPWRR